MIYFYSIYDTEENSLSSGIISYENVNVVHEKWFSDLHDKIAMFSKTKSDRIAIISLVPMPHLTKD